MRSAKMLVRALGVERAVVEDVKWEGVPGLQALILWVRPRKKETRRCPHCRRLCSRYDRGSGPRRWRAPDVGLCPAYVVAEAPRVRCREHGGSGDAVRLFRHVAKSSKQSGPSPERHIGDRKFEKFGPSPDPLPSETESSRSSDRPQTLRSPDPPVPIERSWSINLAWELPEPRPPGFCETDQLNLTVGLQILELRVL